MLRHLVQKPQNVPGFQCACVDGRCVDGWTQHEVGHPPDGVLPCTSGTTCTAEYALGLV